MDKEVKLEFKKMKHKMRNLSVQNDELCLQNKELQKQIEDIKGQINRNRPPFSQPTNMPVKQNNPNRNIRM